MADTKEKAPETRQQRLTEQYLFRRKIYGPPEGKKSALVEVPVDFPTEEELKARAEKTQLGNLGGPSTPLAISARSAKAAMLEEGEDIEDDETDEEEEDEQPVAVDAKGEPLYTADSTEDGSVEEAMEGGPPVKKRRAAAKKVKKGRK